MSLHSGPLYGYGEKPVLIAAGASGGLLAEDFRSPYRVPGLMCGIAGIVDFGGKPVAADELSRLTDLLAHRGPDGAGAWFSADHTVGLGHRRLAVIDVSDRGSQPMLSGDGRYTIVFNGEIYNFLELRRELENTGAVFRSDSDTEVILSAWSAWGEDMLNRFNGMWALAIYDNKTRELFLARDRFGIKPLLYVATQYRFIFASEQRALVRSRLTSTSVDAVVAAHLMVNPFGVEGSERTLCKEVRRLQGGHLLRLRQGRVQLRRWWRTVDHLPGLPKSSEERVEQFGSLFQDAVALRMRSDVPIGTCLSGGFDSSAIVCAMAAHERAGGGARDSKDWRHAFVASFPGSSHDERPEAELAAKYAGVTPHILEIDSRFALEKIDTILDDLDDVYLGLPTAGWLIYRELRRNRVLVSLDGHGADELMGGYRQEGGALAFWVRNAISSVSSRAKWANRGTSYGRTAMMVMRGHSFLRNPWSGSAEHLALVGEDDPLPREWGALNRRLYHMFHGSVLPTILRNFDRASMAHGIEVRMPFMDWRLVTFTMALPDSEKTSDGYTKWIARRAMAGKMPDQIRINPRKVGFNSPMPNWLNGPLAGWVAELFERPVPAFAELVDEHRLKRAISHLTANREWNWDTVGRIWPYVNMRWAMSRLSA